MRAQFRLRIRIILGLFSLIALGIAVRLYVVQIADGEIYSAKADQQVAYQQGGLFDRGSIFFTRKDGTAIAAATLSTGFLVAINPQKIADPEGVYDAVSAVAPAVISREAFNAAVTKKQQVYIEIAHHLREESGRALLAHRWEGVQVLKESWRTYPGDTLASQTVGFVAFGGGDLLVGQTGIETMYDGTLSRSGDALYSNFFAKLFSDVTNLLVTTRDVHEGDIVTTLEPMVQARLEANLIRINDTYHSHETGGIIMDPATGEIIAMASAPSFNPNDLARADPTRLGNPLVEHVHEFGSTVKPLTIAAGLDAGVITPTTTYHDVGCITVDTKKVCNWDQKGRGTVGVPEIILQSLNVGAAWVATELGQERFRTYFTKLFGAKSNIDLPNEAHPLIGNLSRREQIGYDTAAYGQGIAITPVQMIRAIGALANQGVLVTPHVVKAVRLTSGEVHPLTWASSTPVFSREAVRDVVTMMTTLVDTKLSDGQAKIPTMSVAAKTGTAQLTDGKGGYYADRYFHSFVGFFPSYNPRFVLLLYTDDPQGVQYASETLNDTFLDLVHFLIDYYVVPPDRGLTYEGNR